MIEGKWVCWHDNHTITSAETIAVMWKERYSKAGWSFRVVPSVLHPNMFIVEAKKDVSN